MKKGLIFVLGILSFLGINSVSAKEIYLEYDTNINEIRPYINEIGYDKINDSINKLIQHYNENLSTDYPYYIISLTKHNGDFHIVLSAFNDSGYEDYFGRYFDQTFDTSYLLVHHSYSAGTVQFEFDFESNNILELGINSGFNYLSLFDIDSDYQRYNVYNYYYSNFDLYYRGDILPTSNTPNTAGYLNYLKKDDILYFPSFGNSSIYSNYQANTKFLIQPYYLYDNNNSFEPEDSNYITIDLNQYSYVILSLKDYTPRETFEVPAYTKGQLCPTTLYNYGTDEKKDYVSGWQSPPCGVYLEDYTFVTFIIREEDIKNHAVYYFTAYDYSKPNLVKVKDSIFNITYITKENENNPSVVINGKNYNTIPYSNLTDTSVNTEINGIDPTWSCAKYDTNCIMDSSGIDVNDLFTKPLEVLENIWDTISSVFKLITEFISLLPPIMQGFLYLAFAVGISIGIIKIIL